PAIAVGLSAISFSAPLQKDAAPIPNAFGSLHVNKKPENSNNSQIPRFSVFQFLSFSGFQSFRFSDFQIFKVKH
ncbi:MAG: hypothetical protein IKJ64_05930, partial [Bacteroidales bacterium]|nr:hypothetical protein [Bacteroidales bacterium]